jgi:hypothetical protein
MLKPRPQDRPGLYGRLDRAGLRGDQQSDVEAVLEQIACPDRQVARQRQRSRSLRALRALHFGSGGLRAGADELLGLAAQPGRPEREPILPPSASCGPRSSSYSLPALLQLWKAGRIRWYQCWNPGSLRMTCRMRSHERSSASCTTSTVGASVSASRPSASNRTSGSASRFATRREISSSSAPSNTRRLA